MNLALFGGGSVDVLVCTDLAARGLDIPNVEHVVQFEFATNVVQYLHRLGRTGRAGGPGRVTHFYDPSSELQALIKSATEAGTNLDESFSRKRGFRKKVSRLAKDALAHPVALAHQRTPRAGWAGRARAGAAPPPPRTPCSP